MDKETILLMLNEINTTGFIGPKNGGYSVGERVNFALDKELIRRTDHGNFEITTRGADILAGKIDWNSL